MARKKQINVPPELNKIIFWIVFVIIWVWSLLSPVNSSFWHYLNISLSFLFWEYYKFIFSPSIIIFSILLFKNWINFYFNFYRAVWLLLFFSSACTIVWYFTDYKAIFNLLPVLKDILW